MQWRTWRLITVLMGILSLGTCWQMALRFWLAWWYSSIGENGAWIKYGIGIMVMEFVVIHSGGLLTGASISTTNKKKRLLFLSGLVLLYFGFAGLISSLFSSLPLFFSFVSIMFCRLVTGFFAVSEENISAVVDRSTTSGLLYVVVGILSTIIPLPEGDIGNSPAGYQPESGEGVWQQSPQNALAAGVIYFLAMGIYEIFAARKNLQKSFEMEKQARIFYGQNEKKFKR